MRWEKRSPARRVIRSLPSQIATASTHNYGVGRATGVQRSMNLATLVECRAGRSNLCYSAHMVASLFSMRLPRLLACIALFACAVCPAALFIATFSREFFNQCEFWKLILIAFSISMPIVIVNLWSLWQIVLQHPEAGRSVDSEVVWPSFIAASSVLSIFPLFIPSLVCLLLGTGGPRVGALISLFVQAFIYGVLRFFRWWCSPCEGTGGTIG
jgi:hypothetical protein